VPKKKVNQNAWILGIGIFFMSFVVFVLTIKMLQAKQTVKYLVKPPDAVCSIMEAQNSGNRGFMQSMAWLEYNST